MIAWISLCESKENFPHLKDEILEQTKLVQEALPAKRGCILKELAKLHLKDQNQEGAFKTFLEALSNACLQSNPPIAESEEKFCQAAKMAYLDHTAWTTQQAAERICENYACMVNANPEWQHLKLYVAVSYANLGKYFEFFDLFYDAYCFNPQHFLAYKTKAILYIKLFEREREEKCRNLLQHEVKNNLMEALDREPADHTIYKMLITFAPAHKKHAVLVHCLNKILAGNMIVPRGDVAFYVERAVDANEILLARQFLDKARSWYKCSKIINAAQEYINIHMNSH